MPNRILKESICYSDDLDKLTPFEETVFYRLIVRADDYGRLDARPSFLKSTLFVTKPGITEKNVHDAVSKLASVGLVRLYEVDGKPFLLFPKWNLHQRVRNSKEKYPSPQFAASCGELQQDAANCGLNPIQSESNPNPNPIQSKGADAHGRAGKGEKESLRDIMDAYAPEGPLREALEGFVELRKKSNKLPLTQRALKAVLKKLDELSAGYEDRQEEAKIAILDQSVEHGWATVYELKNPLPNRPAEVLHMGEVVPRTLEELQTLSLEELME